MITITDLTKQRLVDSLYSTTCPACGDRKGEEKSLCYSCFSSLPGRTKAALYNLVGHGYEEAMLAALQHLKAEKFHEERPVIS